MKKRAFKARISSPFLFGFGNIPAWIHADGDGKSNEKLYIGANGSYRLVITDESLFDRAIKKAKANENRLFETVAGIVRDVGEQKIRDYVAEYRISPQEADAHTEAFEKRFFDALANYEELNKIGVAVKDFTVESLCIRGADDPAPVLLPPETKKTRLPLILGTVAVALILVCVGWLLRPRDIPDVPRETTGGKIEMYMFGTDYIPDENGFGATGDFGVLLKYGGKPISDMENVCVSLSDDTAGTVTVGEDGWLYFHPYREAEKMVTISYRDYSVCHIWVCHNASGLINSVHLSLIMPGFEDPISYGFGCFEDFYVVLEYDGIPISDMENVTVTVENRLVGSASLGKNGVVYFYPEVSGKTNVLFSYRGETISRIWDNT